MALFVELVPPSPYVHCQVFMAEPPPPVELLVKVTDSGTQPAVGVVAVKEGDGLPNTFMMSCWFTAPEEVVAV